MDEKDVCGSEHSNFQYVKGLLLMNVSKCSSNRTCLAKTWQILFDFPSVYQKLDVIRFSLWDY